MELEARQVRFARQVSVPVVYKGQEVALQRIDLLVENTVVIELKAVESLCAVHVGQVLAYLKAGAFPVGLLINFNVPTLKSGIRRLVWNV